MYSANKFDADVPQPASISELLGLDVTYINPFIRETVHVFEVMLGWHIERQSLKVKQSFAPSHDISGMICLTGRVSGVVVLSFSRELACRMLGQLTGTPTSFLNEEVVDFVGELTNTVSGRAAAELSNYDIHIGLPSVLIGRTKTVEFPFLTTPLEVEFKTPWTPVALDVGLTNDPSNCSRFSVPPGSCVSPAQAIIV